MPRIPVRLVTWEEIVEWSRGLAKRIEEQGYQPDVVIAIARGGFVPARLICDFLGVENLLSIQSQHWTEAAMKGERAVIKFKYTIDLRGMKALLVDDIVDTGDSMILAKEFIEQNWKPDVLKTAALQWISSVAKIKPDFYYIEVKEWVWFQYPWTRLEDTVQFIKRMLTEEARSGKTAWKIEEIKEKFKEWYGIMVEDQYFLKALEILISKGMLRVKDDTYYVVLK
ncbi:MAG TPA: phosphoribosyltransferase [Ignisphaera sp.]|uniref:Phosphoribosyltransferase n=1 Tax=Ignisphaera aggregans TaxID=334771 RepID=A0A833DUH4_9CREN|nr:phosphoribosyltransferase [Ignisphaera sp.]HIP56904.1 phosphoribosyltransferase [Ignisphaera aggregans]